MLLNALLVAVLRVPALVHYAKLAIISAQLAHAIAAMHLALHVQEGWQLNVAHATLVVNILMGIARIYVNKLINFNNKALMLGL